MSKECPFQVRPRIHTEKASIRRIKNVVIVVFPKLFNSVGTDGVTTTTDASEAHIAEVIAQAKTSTGVTEVENG